MAHGRGRRAISMREGPAAANLVARGGGPTPVDLVARMGKQGHRSSWPHGRHVDLGELGRLGGQGLWGWARRCRGRGPGGAGSCEGVRRAEL